MLARGASEPSRDGHGAVYTYDETSLASRRRGGGEKRFYRELMHKADTRFEGHLTKLKQRNEKEKERKYRAP